MALPKTGKAVIRWYGAQLAHGTDAAAWRGLRKAADFLKVQVIRNISTSARAGGTKGSRSPSARAGPPMQMNRSKPGEFPHRDTGKLAQSIYWKGDRGRMLCEVGTTLFYGAVLEVGAKTSPDIYPVRKRWLVFGVDGQWVFAKHTRPKPVAARPYLWATVRRFYNTARRIVVNAVAGYYKGGARFG